MAEPKRKTSSFAKSGFRNSVFEAPVIMEGWLKKHSTGLLKRWQKRYFCVAGHYMKYYDDETKNEKALKGTIDLNGLQAASQTAMEGELQLIIKGETIILHADSASEAQRWTNILEPMIGIGVDENPLFKMRARPEQRQAMEREKKEREEKNKAAQEKLVQQRKVSTSAAVHGMARSVKRPLRVTVHSAAGLRACDKVNPLICISAIDRTHGYEQELQHMTPPKAGSTSPAFNERVVLPGVTGNVDIVFTVLNFGETGELEFLGQASKSMGAGAGELWNRGASEETLKLLPMDDVKPRDGEGKEMRIENDTAPPTWDGSEASITISIEPFAPSYSLCGDLDKTGGDRYASVWKPRWCCLVEHSLYYYDGLGTATPKAVIDLRNAEEIAHPDSIIEHVSIKMPEKLWQFRTATVVEGGQWWWKLRQAAQMATDSQSGGAAPGISLAQSEHASTVPVRKLSSW